MAVKTTMHTHSHLALGDALQTKIELCRYEEKLEESLSKLSERRVAVLEQIFESHLSDHKEESGSHSSN